MARKKKRDAAASDIEEMQIRSWDDWFRACGEAIAPVKRYEDCVREWERMRADDEVEALKAYARRHDRGFWELEGVLYGRLLKKMLLGGMIGAVAGFVAGFAFLFFTTHAVDFAGAIPALVIGLLLGVALGFLPLFLKGRSLERKMADAEPGLARVLRYVAPKYRNSFCLDAFYDMYCSYGIANYERAIDVVDEHIKNNARTYEPIQVLFDVRYHAASDGNGEFVADPEDEAASGDPGAPDLSAPGLPADAELHIHEGVDDPEERLAELIGMASVKKQVRQMKSRVEFFGEATGNSGNNLLFLGPAGSGKTEIARIITRILYDFGYIRANRIMEVDGDYLKSPYVGQTGERVNAIVTAAKGGVLFVDEAYLLYDEKDTNSTGKEAIGVLLKAMEDLRDDLVVILAGYEDGMNRLMASNEGFSSRIKYKIYFDDYSAEELGEIFKLFMEKGTQSVKKIEDDAYAALVEHFEVARTMPGFGNARAARNALDRILDIHADRYMDGLVGETAKMTIVKGDVDAYVADERERLAADGRNFMATSHLDEKIISFSELKTHTHDGAADPAAELEAMVGLDEVKAEMQAYLRRSEFFRGSGGAAEGAAGNLNMALVGPPGTGKSSLIRIITGYLYQAGYIRENRYVDVTGDFLKAPYVGQTGKRTEAVVEYSKGMLLFVDEAYLLGKTSGTGSDFGAEAVGVLVNAMEKSMGELVVAFAGYGPEMERFFDMNQGLRSRIGTVFELPPYSGKELMKIFQRIAYARGFSCDKGIWPAVAAYVKANMADPSFGNARAMRQLAEKAINRHVDRYSAGEVGEDARMVLDAADIGAL